MNACLAISLSGRGVAPVAFPRLRPRLDMSVSGVTKSALPRLRPHAYGVPLGEADRVLVMLGGFPDTHDVWKETIREFGSEYAILTIPTPDYDRSQLRRRFGYSPDECASMIDDCITDALGPTRQYDVVMHDWGCVWGYALAARRSERVRKMVSIDVGPIASTINQQLAEGKRPKLGGSGTTQRGALWMLPYQLTFALIFWTGARLHPLLGHTALLIAALLAPLLGPMNLLFNPLRQLPRPLLQVRWWMCYPYYQLWIKHILARTPLPDTPLVPDAPVLYVWGERKRCMFHTEEFVAAVRARPGSRAVGFDCSHWVMHERPSELHAEMRAFLLGDSSGSPPAAARPITSSSSSQEASAPAQDDVEVTCDYLVVGAGLSGLGFTDALIQNNRDASVIIVDRHPRCGGHWTLVYPFVRLHTPAAYYGVESLTLGRVGRSGREVVDTADLSSKEELLAYFDKVRTHLTASGRVQLYLGAEYSPNGSLIRTSSGKTLRVRYRKRVGTAFDVQVPAMRPPPFAVSRGVRAVPVHLLPSQLLAEGDVPSSPSAAVTAVPSPPSVAAARYVVVGAGKTGADAVIYLLRHGVQPRDVTWVVSRPAWYFLREALFGRAGKNVLRLRRDFVEALLRAPSAASAYVDLERLGYVGRVDQKGEAPTVFRGAIITAEELALLRTVNVVRGRVEAVDSSAILLEGGTRHALSPDERTLVVDCTARAARTRHRRRPFPRTRSR